MSRLTKDTREQMARALVAHRYKDEAEALAALNRTLADRAYAHIYTPEVLAALKVVEKAVGELTSRSPHIRVNAGGYTLGIGQRLRSRWVQFPHGDNEGYTVIDIYRNSVITDEALIADIKAFAERLKTFNESCPEAYHEAMAVLNTITTTKKLAEAWPEAMPVIGDLVPAECRTLPAVKVEDINEKFGLPPKAEAEPEAADAN